MSRGCRLFAAELTAKRLELIKEAVPSVTRVAILLNPGNAATQFVLSETEATAKAASVELRAFEARQPIDFVPGLRSHGRSAGRCARDFTRIPC